MLNPDLQKIIDIANSLSNDEIATLLECVSNRIDVYVGSVGKHMISSEIESVCMNGGVIQINLELANEESMMDNQFFARGIEAHMTQAAKITNDGE